MTASENPKPAVVAVEELKRYKWARGEVHVKVQGGDDGSTNNTKTPSREMYLVDDAGHRGPVSLHNVVASVHHALVALLDEVDSSTNKQSHAHHCPHSRVHALEWEDDAEWCQNRGVYGGSGVKLRQE